MRAIYQYHNGYRIIPYDRKGNLVVVMYEGGFDFINNCNRHYGHFFYLNSIVNIGYAFHSDMNLHIHHEYRL